MLPSLQEGWAGGGVVVGKIKSGTEKGEGAGQKPGM